MDINLNLDSDSLNSYVENLKVNMKTSDRGTIMISLSNPTRIIRVNAVELLKVVTFLQR